jgi:hypothetical protein
MPASEKETQKERRKDRKGGETQQYKTKQHKTTQNDTTLN